MARLHLEDGTYPVREEESIPDLAGRDTVRDDWHGVDEIHNSELRDDLSDVLLVVVLVIVRWRVVHHFPLDSWIMTGEVAGLSDGTKGMQHRARPGKRLPCVHNDGTATTMKSVGVREFRNHASTYLSGTEPIAVNRHGKVIGFYIPLERDDDEVEHAAVALLPQLWRRSSNAPASP